MPGVLVVTLYDPDGPDPTGSLTGPTVPDADCVGPLSFIGLRDGKEWRLALSSVRVSRKTALGCEYKIAGPVRREMLRELGTAPGPHKKALEERFDIR